MRLVQGLGAALIWSNNAAILTDVFPATERGRALGINQVAGVSGSILGLVAGGVLTTFLGWRSIFWINLSPGAFATVWALPQAQGHQIRGLKGEKLDPLGNVLFGVGLTSFLVGLTLGAIAGWERPNVPADGRAASPRSPSSASSRPGSSNPMMDVRLFRIRAFSAGQPREPAHVDIEKLAIP